MIDESVRFLAAQGKRVVYDAEHFFDAWRDDREYALRCVTAAAEAGAAVVCLCDTNGASLPPFVADVVREVTAALPGAVVGIHAHNDSDCAVASSLGAVAAGAPPGAGHDQRLRRALRQRQPHQHHPGAPAQDGAIAS